MKCSGKIFFYCVYTLATVVQHASKQAFNAVAITVATTMCTLCVFTLILCLEWKNVGALVELCPVCDRTASATISTSTSVLTVFILDASACCIVYSPTESLYLFCNTQFIRFCIKTQISKTGWSFRFHLLGFGWCRRKTENSFRELDGAIEWK